jgi:Kef-type K+ transport system membrane component KefB
LDVPVPTDTRPETLEGTLAGTAFRAQFREELPPPGKSAKAVEKRSAEETFGRLMLAIAIVILGARLIGAGIGRIGQPRVMGEVLAGILLGPTLLGRFAPGIRDYLFPPDIIPLLSAGADIGLAFYMFLVGLELDPGMLRGRAEQAAFISHGSIAAPLALGFATAVPIFTLVGPHTKFLPFALFMGVAMSITAFPVLARILVERRMLKRPVGAMAMGAAAVDDVTAWGLLALAAGVARTGGFTVSLVRVVVLAIVFSAAMAVIGRRLLARVADAYDEVGRIPAGWIAAIFLGVLLSAYVSQQIGIAAIFGAFVMGMVMPRRADLTHDVSRRVEDFVTTVLLPLFFVVAGLKTDIGSLNRPVLWLLTLLLLAVAVIGKWAGAMSAARYAGLPWRESAALGLLMNTRGLTELIVLNIGLELGVVTPAIFTMLVIMALVTTFMAGPLLRLVDRRGEMAAPAEEELRSVAKATEAEVRAPVPERAFLVAPQDERNVEALLRIAEPMARSQPPRELILARLVVLSRGVTGIARDDHQLSLAAAEIHARRDRLVAGGVAARAVAFTSADPGEDLARLAAEHEVDLVLMDGQRPLLGEGVPRGAVGTVLAKAPCDVAVLVERDKSSPDIGPDFPVLVPFGGAEHDWAALELAAWIATSHDARLVLLGAAADLEEGRRDASRLLADASLVVQQLTGIVAEPLLADPGREGIIRAAEGAGVLVIGLSERWREEGLGPVRSTIARQAPSPTLFVRRGERAGALAPREDVTRFSWSMVAPMRRT